MQGTRLLAVPIVAIGLAAVSGASAGNGNGTPLPPAAAQAAAAAPGLTVAGPVRRVTPAAALAAAAAPGADTEIAPASAPTAAGSTPTSTPRIGASAVPARLFGLTLCYSVAMTHWWGTWPYATSVQDDTYWCGNGVTISYRTTHVLLGGGGVCSSHDAYGFKVGGGVGSYYEQETVGGYFDCPTYVPWITLHYNRHFDGVVTADGGAYVTNVSG